MCSVYSGKADLADHVGGSGGWYDKDGNPVKMGEGHGAYYSDEYQDFLAFKKVTGGVLHQHKKVEVTNFNLQFIKEHCNEFDYIEHIEQISDKRTKSGYKELKTYTYKYWGKEYTSLKELNKKGVYITIDIHFNTILDLIPYYPYIVSASFSTTNEDGTHSKYIVISKEPFPISERDDLMRGGYNSAWEHYAKKLQNHYREIVLRYFNPEGREHIEELTFDENRQAKVSKPIDENFDVEWYWDGEIKTHWSSPKVVDYEKGLIEMSTSDYGTDEYKGFLGHTMKVKYVEKKDYPLNLG